MNTSHLTLRTDGACWGNPGPSSIGVSLEDPSGLSIYSLSKYIGRATNNQAEYRALIAGLEEANRLGVQHINIKVDSELIELQIKGKYRVRHPAIKPLFNQAVNLLSHFESYQISRASRNENEAAHNLAQSALKKAGV
jgi:ribonuclease HI